MRFPWIIRPKLPKLTHKARLSAHLDVLHLFGPRARKSQAALKLLAPHCDGPHPRLVFL